MLKHTTLTIAFLVISFLLGAQVTLSTDFTDEANRKDALHNMWTVANRISPTQGGIVRPGLNVNTVRMLGGILKTVDGQKVPDYDYDPCRYDYVNNEYVYNWEPLKARIYAQLNSNYNLFQIVIDQPPWAFQHGYTFIPEGTRDSIHFRENERQSIYGNSLPPADPVAYHAFVKAMMEELIATYGKDQVEKWRFRIGSEIETPEHWYGSKQDFIAHFANTEHAIREVLPGAIVGLHTREPRFLYKNGTVLNYIGEPIASFAQDLIEYCFDHGIRYDFWGISEYLLINNSSDRDITRKYDELIAPFVENPKWNRDATIDIMEYSVVISMNPPDGGGFLTVGSSHSDAFNVVLADMFYDNDSLGLDQVFRWGQRPGTIDPPSVELLASMEGKIRYLNEVSGTPEVPGNMLDAIFSKSDTTHDYDILAYNYGSASLSYQDKEEVELSVTTSLPVGSVLSYRSKYYGKEHNKLQNFLENEPAGGWVLDGWDRNGSPPRTLNAAGEAAWNAYVNPNPWQWSPWKAIYTEARSDGGEGSVIRISTELSSFSFEKVEIRHDPDLVEILKPFQARWTSNEDFEQFSPFQMTTTIADSLFILIITGNYPSVSYDHSFDTGPFDKVRIVVKNETLSDIFWFAWYVDGNKNQLRFQPTPSVNDTSFHAYEVDLSAIANWKGSIDYFKLETANKAGSGTVTLDTIEFITREGVGIQNVRVNSIGNGDVSPSSGTCYTGQQVEFTAMPFPDSQFDGWTGDTTGSENPLFLVVQSDLNLTAHFSLLPEKYTLNTSAINGTVDRDPDLSSYVEGDTVVLTALPNSGFMFESWSGDLSGTENPVRVIMDSSMSITANFSIIQGLTANGHLKPIVIFPNPSTGHFYLDVRNDGFPFYHVFNSQGVEILSGSAKSDPEIEIRDKGIYFIRFETENGFSIQKMIVN